ncbi:tetratricopeptide repeat protein [Streptomyces griseoluteus]|uniref:tetratricopeptide repeat protein n=1 Tax=Streptomyces griseoluteus TaxID=29306 RepID=UPI0036F80103
MTTDKTFPREQVWAEGARSIAAERIGTAISGDVVLPPEALHAAERTDAAPSTSNLPPAGLCLGREEELAWLRRTLAGAGESAITQGGTVHGLGGIGKSTLALHYAHRHRGDYSLIWWINAASPDEIETSLTHLTHRLVPGWAATTERGGLVAWAVQWLAWHDNWLLVYDNVEDAGDLSPYLGALHRGHHLATSRRVTGWPDAVSTWPLGALDADDATDLLCQLVFKNKTPTMREKLDARALVSELGFLPLAVRQAGAYLARNRGVRLDDYRRRLEIKLDKHVPGSDAERTVARVWNLTLHALEQTDPRAVDLLCTAAWLAPDDISHTLLIPLGTDPDDTAEAIGTLADYSMVTDTGTSISIHRLVQTVLRTPQPHTPDSHDADRPARHLAGRERAEQAVLHHATPPTGHNTTTDDQWDTLTPHLITLATTTPPKQHADPLTDAYDSAANRLHEQGHTVRAIPLLEATLTQREQTLGHTHPDTLTSRNNLAGAYRAAGDLDRAIPLYEATLTQCEQVLGDTHPTTAAVRGNLASARHAAKDAGR